MSSDNIMLRALELRLGFNRLDHPEDSEVASTTHKEESFLPMRVKGGGLGIGVQSRLSKAHIVPVDIGSNAMNTIPSRVYLTKEFWRHCENGDIVGVLNVIHRSGEKYSNYLAYALNEYGNNAIMYCCWGLSQDRQLLQLLLDFGVDPCVINSEGSTPLHECCIAGKIDMVELLLSKDTVKSMIDYKDNLRRRRTPLVCAVGYGHVHIVRMLLENGASIDDPSPLKIGCRYRQSHTVKALLEYGGRDEDIRILEELWPEICFDENIAGLVKWKRRKHFGIFIATLKHLEQPHKIFYLIDINAQIASFL